jgi:glycerate kinase
LCEDVAEAIIMKIVVAPQALKGSMDAPEVTQVIARAIRTVYPDERRIEVVSVPVADGGEGTVRALVSATHGELRSARVTGPLGKPVDAVFGLLGPTEKTTERTAVIEMAAAAGLPLVPPERRDPRKTTTYGVGELIRAALDLGCQEIIIGIGGSGTNDGGAGMAQALGARLLDRDGHELPPGGSPLWGLAHIDVSGMDARLQRTKIRVACDVTNPLTGSTGATMVYGPQKGALPTVVMELEQALTNYAERLRDDLGKEVADVPGAGAAGGLGAGLLAFTQAELLPGAQLVLDTLNFGEVVKGAALIITAEGQLDEQTAYGKAVGAVAGAGRQVGAKVIALAGRLRADEAALARLGIDVAIPLPDGPLTQEESMARASELVEAATRRALRLMMLGQGLV